jgi:subtilisin family serine protease
MDKAYCKKIISRMWVPTAALVVAFGLLVGGTDTKAQTPAPATTPYAAGELLVKYKTAFQGLASDSYSRRWGISTLKFLKIQGVHRLKLPDGMAVRDALDLFRQDPQVEFAEPNYYRHIRATPNDTYYSSLWGLPKINTPEGWDVSTDCGSAAVALIDSGADYMHPDLAANIWTNTDEIAANGIDDDANGKIDDTRGWDFVYDDNNPMDGNGHGTHVAGIIGAVGNNARGVTGICWNAKIMILRAFDASGSATVADTIEAMDYARQNGAKVINASYSDAQFSQAEYDAIALLNSAGILFITAAGNETTNNDQTPSYPANYDLPNIIAVAATDSSDRLASFSNFGRSTVDVAAPGSSVYSTYMSEVAALTVQDFESGTAGWTLNAPFGRANAGYNSSWSLADSPAGNYADNINVSAVAPGFSMAGRSGGHIEFSLRGNILNDGDVFLVETASNSGGPWTAQPVWLYDTTGWLYFPAGVAGASPDWSYTQVYLNDPEILPNLYFRFRLSTNANGVADGVYIDDVSVQALTPGNDDYIFTSGTSTAAPYVSGLAALIWGTNPGLSAAQLKGRILDCVDRVSSLSGYIRTAGRINVNNSIRNIPAPPSNLDAAGVSGSRIDLSWDDNYSNAISVKIERREAGSTTFAEIVTVSPGVPTYQDTSVQATKTYYYRARATNSDNLSTHTSEVSAIAAAPPSGGGGGGGGGGGCFIMTLLGD